MTVPRIRDESVEEVRILAAEPGPAEPVLPEWAAPALIGGSTWPELEQSYVVEVRARNGATGHFGPCTAVVARIVCDQIAPAIAGIDATRYRVFERVVAAGRHRSGAQFRLAESAVDLALWDLRSRIAGSSVPALLGGPVRNDVAVYASALGVDAGHPLAPDIARWIVEKGFWGQKWALPGGKRGEEPSNDVARLERIREAAGPSARLMVDAKRGWTVDYFRRLAPALAELAIVWVEEPFMAGVRRAADHVSAAVGLPIAGGEHAYDPETQLRLLVDQEVDVWQPDVSWQGGLAQVLRMVDLAGSLGLRVFPHGAGFAGALVLGALTAEDVLPAIEYHLTLEPVRQCILAEPIVPIAGLVPVRRAWGLTGSYRCPGGRARLRGEDEVYVVD